jgi:hypothetical protein
MMAIQNFEPERFEELKSRVKEGRVELVNAFFLEPTINLTGGEALAKMGVEGLRWQQQVMGVRPDMHGISMCAEPMRRCLRCVNNSSWMLSFYTRMNRSGKTLFWSFSPDGSKILTAVPGTYSEDLGGAYSTKTPVNEELLKAAAEFIANKPIPPGVPTLILGGYKDYALPPALPENPTQLLNLWKSAYPQCELCFGGASP